MITPDLDSRLLPTIMGSESHEVDQVKGEVKCKPEDIVFLAHPLRRRVSAHSNESHFVDWATSEPKGLTGMQLFRATKRRKKAGN